MCQLLSFMFLIFTLTQKIFTASKKINILKRDDKVQTSLFTNAVLYFLRSYNFVNFL